MAIGERVSGAGLEVAFEVAREATGLEGDVQFHLPRAVSVGGAVLTGVVSFQATFEVRSVADIKGGIVNYSRIALAGRKPTMLTWIDGS